MHVIGPELGFTQPGMTLVCGDSHTSTHGALASLAFGVGTSDVEHVLATQCINVKKEKNFNISVINSLSDGVSSKDLILYIIREIGTSGGTGFTIEFSGDCISKLSIEARMTLCNMSIEGGAKSGLVAFDNRTLDYVIKTKNSPSKKYIDDAIKYWETLHSDDSADFDKSIEFDASVIKPQVSWGTSPEMTVDIDGKVPDPNDIKDKNKKQSYINALKYMDLDANQKIDSIELDKIFIGSCTNSRIEDLRCAALEVEGKRISSRIKQAIVVPGSGPVSYTHLTLPTNREV